MAQKVNRHEQMMFLNIGTPEAPEFKVVGVGIADLGIAYNPQVDSEKWVIHKSATSEITGYQPQSDVTQKCYKGDPVFDYINELRRTLAMGSEAGSEVLNVDNYDSYKSTKFACTIAINNYMSSEADIEYTIHYNGDPIQGTSVLDTNGGATFTPTGSV